MGFVNRKKSGNIIGGSRLIVDGQNIFNVQVIPPGFNKLSSEQDNYAYRKIPVTPTPTPAFIIDCDFTGRVVLPNCDFIGIAEVIPNCDFSLIVELISSPTPPPSLTPTKTPTPTLTPTNTQTPTVTPTTTPIPNIQTGLWSSVTNSATTVTYDITISSTDFDAKCLWENYKVIQPECWVGNGQVFRSFVNLAVGVRLYLFYNYSPYTGSGRLILDTNTFTPTPGYVIPNRYVVDMTLGVIDSITNFTDLPACVPIISDCIGTPTPTPTMTQTPTQTSGASPSQTPTKTPTQTPTQTSGASPSQTPTQTPTNTPTPAITQTPTNTPTPAVTQTPTNTPTPAVTQTPTNTPTPAVTQTPTNTPTPAVTQTPTNTPTPAVTQTPTPTQTVTPSSAPPVNSVEWSEEPYGYGGDPSGGFYFINGTVEIIGDPVTFRLFVGIPDNNGPGSFSSGVNIWLVGSDPSFGSDRYVEIARPRDVNFEAYSTSFTLPAGIYNFELNNNWFGTGGGGEGGVLWTQG